MKALLLLLRKHGVEHISPIGVDGNYCIASSAADGKKYGFAVTLPCEYIGVQNKKRFEERKEIFISHGIVIEE